MLPLSNHPTHRSLNMSEFGLRMALLELVQYNDVDEDFTFDPSLGGHERIIRRVRLSADNTEYDD